MKKLDKIYFKNPEKYIPKGPYCYDKNGICLFWDINKSKHHQLSGYCHYLKSGDWMKNGTFILWDQVKECGINEYTEDEINDIVDDFTEGE